MQEGAGAGFAPDQVPMKPNVAEPPTARVLFQATGLAVKAAPDWVTVAFQAWLTC